MLINPSAWAGRRNRSPREEVKKEIFAQPRGRRRCIHVVAGRSRRQKLKLPFFFKGKGNFVACRFVFAEHRPGVACLKSTGGVDDDEKGEKGDDLL
ncbi:hypothetical protein KSP40_PGU001923 [Platanthera guangdongensis]|uniref:Uncharacterized protein n=1 Tax=Platanthera guangdongensis TaxID=2320717 RepID=A0ABR2M0K9_9ASPA